MELIVYVGILAVSAALLTGILSTTLKVQNRESASNEVTSQLNFVMQNINRLVRESSNIEIATSTATSTLKLRMKDSAKDPTCLSLVNGVIKLAEGPGSNPNNCTDVTSDLTNNRVIADKLDFTKFSQYPGHDTVSVDIQLTYNSQNPQQRLTRELRSAIARVSAATFDSNLLPGSTSYTIGQSGSSWYDAFISNLLYLGRLSDDPTASQEGAIYYNTANSAFRGYKSSGWSNLGESLWTASGNNIYNSNSGNVGINTNNPASRLSIKGNVGIGTGYASVAAPTNGMIVQSKVGIGTTNPAYELDVTGDARITGKLIVPFRGALVKRTTSQSIPNNTVTNVNWDAEEYDTDNIHDNVTNNERLTVPSGVTKVKICGNDYWPTNNSGDRMLRLYKNGAYFPGTGRMAIRSAASAYTSQNICSAVVSVTSGDYFTMQVWQNSADALNLEAGEPLWFSMEIIE